MPAAGASPLKTDTSAWLTSTASSSPEATAQWVLGAVLVAFLVPLTVIDLRSRLLPNRLTAPAAVLAIVLGTLLDPGGEVERLAAGLAAGGFFYVARLVNPQGMGGGDVKLAGVLGLFLGREVAVAVTVALLAGVVAGAIVIARRGVAIGRSTAVPFGPFLALGGLAAVLAPDALATAYLDAV